MEARSYNLLNSAEHQAMILIVDDVPENLGLLHESLDQRGYTVLLSTDALSAIEIAHRYQPDLILMDGHMPQLDGFDCCKQLKSSPLTQHIPIIFMTGLTETEHLIRGFQAGGVDYITKPLNIDELVIRVFTHLKHAKLLKQQQQVIDISQIAIIAVDEFGQRLWQTPYAQQLLELHLSNPEMLVNGLISWFEQIKLSPQDKTLLRCSLSTASQQFQFSLLSPWQTPSSSASSATTYLVQLRTLQSSPESKEILKACPALTAREAEVMHWLILGKTNKDIADILALSPRTINKHLEHIFEKLNVETRTAAVSFVVNHCQNK